MASTTTNLATFRKVFAERMRNAGFPQINNARMQKRLIEGKLWEKNAPTRIVQTGETIYNRGINSKMSSFFVFVKSEPSKNQVTVYYYNPDIGSKAPMRERHWKDGKKGAVKAGQEYLIRKVYKGTGDPTAFAEQVLGDVLHYASLKPHHIYRMESHIHCGWMPKGYAKVRKFQDDGMSQFEDVIRMNALYARDIVSLTSHNSFDRHKFLAMQIIAQEMGMVMVPGMELTAPGNTPNGPHLLLWFSNETAANEGRLIATKKKSDFRMPPFNDDVPLHTVLPMLNDRLSKLGELIICAAHPFNLHNAKHPVYDVGMLSTLETGPYKPETIDDLFDYVDAVESWNMTMGNARGIPELKHTFLRELVHELVTMKYGNGLKSSPNAVAMALAAHFAVPFESFGTDDHYTPPMNYVADGAPQAGGHTWIDFGHAYGSLTGKPTSQDLIRMLRNGLINMGAQVFTETRDEYLQVPWGRREMNSYTGKLRKELSEKGNNEYVKAILSDLARFKLDAGQMQNLMRSYGWKD